MDKSEDDGNDVLSQKYDPSGELSLPLHIVQLVAIASDQEATNLEPLGYSIDTDAVEALVDSLVSNNHDGVGEISFLYEGYNIEIHHDGMVVIQERNDILP